MLFITWDGPQTSYMEGLFMPIFSQIRKTENIEFHVLQFTWAGKEKVAHVRKVADSMGIQYQAVPICRKPIALLGSIFTLFKGIRIIRDYIKNHGIDIVMPRSTMPAIMMNRLKSQNIKILFDADGLPLEERVDFSGLSTSGQQYKWLKKEETKLLTKANGVITRSHKAVDIHIKNIGEQYRSKFAVVFNGRDVTQFQPDENHREQTRKELNFEAEETIFVYCGSLGPQYGWKEMIAVFEKFHAENPTSKFLILSGNAEFTLDKIPAAISDSVIVKSIPFHEVPKYLNCADIAFAIRKPTFSMQGVAPIKLGEYLLMGLPTIASKGIGDTDDILSKLPQCFLFDHADAEAVDKAVRFSLESNDVASKNEIRDVTINYFSLEKSAESYRAAFRKL